MTYTGWTNETSLKIHEAAKAALGDKMPKPAENAPVWSDGSLYLRMQLDCDCDGDHNMKDEDRITDYIPDYSSAANSLPALLAVEPNRELSIIYETSVGYKVWFGYASGGMPEDMVGYGYTLGDALEALLMKVLEVE